MSQHKHQGIGDHNKCRHPGGETSQLPWCYTGSPKQEKWEYCLIERCDSELKLSHESLVNDFYFYFFTHSRHAEQLVNLQVNKKIDFEHTAGELFKNYNEKLVPIFGNGKSLNPRKTGVCEGGESPPPGLSTVKGPALVTHIRHQKLAEKTTAK